jgi:hypothetical protein
MAGSRGGVSKGGDDIRDGTLVRDTSPRRGVLGTDGRNSVAPYAPSTIDGIYKRVKNMRKAASLAGWMIPNALAALDHFLDCSGTFREIPPWKAGSIHSWFGQDHLAQAKAAFFGTTAKGLSAPVGKATAVALVEAAPGGAKFPSELHFTLTWLGIGGDRGLHGFKIRGYEATRSIDDRLCFFGTAVSSRVRFTAKLTGPTTYRVGPSQWLTYVVDNYDWEGDKGLFPIDLIPGWPSQKEMNLLHQSGKARSYQRSSRSWTAGDQGITPVEIDFSGMSWADVQAIAASRKKFLKEQQEASQKNEQGALPIPPPAEEALAGETDIPRPSNVG